MFHLASKAYPSSTNDESTKRSSHDDARSSRSLDTRAKVTFVVVGIVAGADRGQAGGMGLMGGIYRQHNVYVCTSSGME